MKSEELIKQNLYAKLAIFVSSAKDDDRLLEHIRMLDWVLSGGRTRNITQILDAWNAWPSSSNQPLCEQGGTSVRCQALDENLNRCRTVVHCRMIDYFGDNELYGSWTGKKEPTCVRVGLCRKHREEKK